MPVKTDFKKLSSLSHVTNANCKHIFNFLYKSSKLFLAMEKDAFKEHLHRPKLMMIIASANIMLGLIANKRLPNSVLFIKNHNNTHIAVCNWHCELTLKCSLFSLMLLTLTVNVFSKFC